MLSNKNIGRICKILHKNDINTSRHSLKRWPPRAIQWIWEGKLTVFRQIGGKERIKGWVGEVHQSQSWWSQKPLGYGQKNEHVQINWGQCCLKTFHDLVNSNNNWKQHCTWGTTSYVILGLPPENMAMTPDIRHHTIAFEWMFKGCTYQDWLWDHLFWSSKAHFTIWIWVINWTSLIIPMHFFSWSD